MPNYKQELNTEQYNVVTHGEGACLVLAGAGSGKTRTIIYRVMYLLEQGVRPEEILLVTFTNKAAREMMERIVETSRRGVSTTRLPWAGTFHHIAFRILKQYAPLLGYKNNFTILDSDDSRDVMKLCLKQEGVDRKARRFPSARVVLSIISFARNSERTIEDVLDEKYPNWLDIADVIGRIAEEYRKRKLSANAMDFDDLLVNLYVLLLKSENVRKKFATQFRYVLVDEYQDTNKIQASIVKLFASVHKNILVVGDDAQSIYSFRAAHIGNILEFEKEYPGAEIFRLETNYRSTPEILAVANDVISNNVSQYEKELKSIVDGFVKPEVHVFSDQPEEAEFIAERVLALRDEGIPLNKMAVLFRAAFHSQALELELTKRDIPYEYRGGVRFFERAHIKDVLAYLRIFSNREDTIAWGRVLNMQVGIGPATVQKILSAVRKSEDVFSLSEHVKLSARAKIGWHDFLQVWEKVIASDGTPAGLIQAVLDSKYIDYLQSEYPDYRERKQDITQLASFAEKETDVTTFLAEATLQEQHKNLKQQSGGASEDDEEKVVLSTIHQAKGLEWESVFVMHLGAGQFPNERALKEKKGIEEERRLFYVAVTRAKKQLYLSYPLTGGYTMTLGGPSMFLEELDRSLVDIRGGIDTGTTVFSDPSDDVDDIVYEPFEDAEWGTKKTSFLKSIDEL
jgi:DNA helicase II / ATP-dependent DNA helicase PcrA